MYTAKTLTKTHEISNPDNWKHIPGQINTADHGTRVLTQSDIRKMWLEPVDFLSTSRDSWKFAEDNDPHICPTRPTQLQTPDKEVKKLQHEVDYSTLPEFFSRQ